MHFIPSKSACEITIFPGSERLGGKITETGEAGRGEERRKREKERRKKGRKVAGYKGKNDNHPVECTDGTVPIDFLRMIAYFDYGDGGWWPREELGRGKAEGKKEEKLQAKTVGYTEKNDDHPVEKADGTVPIDFLRPISYFDCGDGGWWPRKEVRGEKREGKMGKETGNKKEFIFILIKHHST